MATLAEWQLHRLELEMYMQESVATGRFDTSAVASPRTRLEAFFWLNQSNIDIITTAIVLMLMIIISGIVTAIITMIAMAIVSIINKIVIVII